jgi:radical SAM protein with 4Fe4S-binding SPASM domain
MGTFDFNSDLPIGLPAGLSFHSVGNHHLIISALQANWVSLTHDEFACFELIAAGLTPNEVESSLDDSTALSDVLQILASKRFFDNSTIEDQHPKNVAHMYLTNACNLRCKHCYMHSGLAEPQSLTTEEWLSFLDSFAANGGTHVNFSGGEALAFEGFWCLLDRAAQHGLKVYVLTNGTLVTLPIAEKIAAAAYQVQISIDGPTPKSNDSLRGKGMFRRAMEGLYHFRGLPTAVRVAMVATPNTIDDFEENFVEFARKLYVDFGDQLQLRISIDMIEGRSVHRYDSLTSAQLQRRVDALFDQLWGYSTRPHADAVGFKRQLRNKNCGFGREISVKSTGDVYPCPIQIDKLGSIRSDGISTLFERVGLEDVAKSIDNFEECKSCDLKYICGGGCRVANYQHSGSYTKPHFCNENYIKNFYRRLVSADLGVEISPILSKSKELSFIPILPI